jgi:hypothetical protein
MYCVHSGGEPVFGYQVPIEEARRARVVSVVLSSGVLVAGASARDAGGSGPWLSVCAAGRVAWLRLDVAGCLGGVPIGPAVLGLVPSSVWARCARQRSAWLAGRAGCAS